MKRSEINAAYLRAKNCFAKNGWTLPPQPRWDITDCGLGRFATIGLVLINLAEEPEYSEKLIYCWAKQGTPMHAHKIKKEDIICRSGEMAIELWSGDPRTTERNAPFQAKKNGMFIPVESGSTLQMKAGERITLEPGVWHAFWAESDECIIGEVSTANDDVNDNYFVDPNCGRFPAVEEDEPALIRLISDK
jgi:D-lyxose ketol-isomerase